jgi:hypothetical protein
MKGGDLLFTSKLPNRPSTATGTENQRNSPPAEPIQYVLRIAVAAEFAGHGAFAWAGEPSWITFVTMWGFSPESAISIMRWVGGLDIVLASIVLLRPIPAALAWMTFWGFFTALLRPLSGGLWIEFVERGANWGAPLALFLLLGRPKTLRDWFR